MKKNILLLFLAFSLYFTKSLIAQITIEERAKIRFAEAIEHYKKGEYEKAIEKMLESYEIMPNPAFLYNIAIIYEKMEHHQSALKYYTKFYEQGAPQVGKDVIMNKITEIQNKLKSIEEKVKSGPEIPCRFEFFAQSQKERESIDVVILKKQIKEERKVKEKTYILKWVTVGAATSSIAGGVIFGLIARNKYNDAKNLTKKSKWIVEDEKKLSNLKSEIRTNALLADIFLGVGVGLSIASLYLFLKKESSSVKKDVFVGGSKLKDGGFISFCFSY